MKTLLLPLLLLGACCLPAQWRKLDGPFDGFTFDFAGAGNVIYTYAGKICYASQDKGAHWSAVSDFPFYPGRIAAGKNETLYATEERRSDLWPDDWPKELRRQNERYGEWETILDTTDFEFPPERILSVVAIDNRMIVGTNLNLYYSSNRGDTWSLASSEVVYGISEIIVATDNLFFARDGWRIHRSTNKGITWDVVYQGATFLHDISWSGTQLYGFTQTTNQLIRGSYLGENWESLTVDSLVIHPDFNDNVYLVSLRDSILLITSGGCYHGGITNFLSYDRGNSWHHFRNNFGGDAIAGLEQYRETILACTYGQGICSGNYLDGHLRTAAEGITAPRVLNAFVSDSVFWVDRESGLWRSLDQGRTWEKSRNWQYYCNAEGKTFVSAGQLYFFDVEAQTLERYDKNLDEWVHIPYPGGYSGTQVFGNKTSLFVQRISRFWVSHDSATTWTEITNLPFQFVDGFTADDALWTASYYDTDTVYLSSNEGQSWIPHFDPRPPFAFVLQTSGDAMIYKKNNRTLARWMFHNDDVEYFSPVLLPIGDTLNFSGFFTKDESGIFWLAHSAYGLLFSKDSGRHWQIFHAPLTDERTYFLYVNGPYMIAATAQGLLLYDTDYVPRWPENETLTLQLYPNPNAGTARLLCSEFIEVNTRFSLFDVSGKLMHSESLLPGEAWEIRTSGLPAGVYYGLLVPTESAGQHHFLSVKWMKF